MVSGQSATLVAAAESHEVFSPEECGRIVALRDLLGWDQARVEARSDSMDREVESTIRETERTHLLASKKTEWIYQRLAQTVERVNGETWQLRISHMEPIQLLRYPVGGHYSWHTDLGARGVISLRKVSLTLLLSPPEDFEGGQLELQAGGQVLMPDLRQGSTVLFPAWQRHRVTPVTRGMRDALVLWVVSKRSLR